MPMAHRAHPTAHPYAGLVGRVAALVLAGLSALVVAWAVFALASVADTYGNVGEEGSPKALTLIGDISIRPVDGTLEDFDGEVVVIKDEEILYLSVTYIARPGAIRAPTAESTRKPWRWTIVLAMAAGVLIGLALSGSLTQ